MDKPRKKATDRRLPDDRPLTFRGWISTDADEIRRQEWRGRLEIAEVCALDESLRPFGDEVEGGVAASIGGFVARISRMIADMATASRGAAG